MDTASGLAEAINGAVHKLPHERLALAFSGGLDSGTLAHLLRARDDVTLYTVGVEGSDDLEQAAGLAREIGYVDGRFRSIVVTQDDVQEATKVVPKAIGSALPMLVSISIPFYILSKEVGEGVIVSGQGADELFGGYHRYGRMEPSEGEEAMRRDALALLDEENMREERLAALYGKRVMKPYLETGVMEIALSIPYEIKIAGGRRKAVLRDAAAVLGVPEMVRERKKRALQFSTGISKVVRGLAQERGMEEVDYLSEYLN